MKWNKKLTYWQYIQKQTAHADSAPMTMSAMSSNHFECSFLIIML